jgi:hypothetical protein
MSNDDKILIPNTFQTPNALVDEVMPNVSGPAFKALLAITRLTLGWNHLGAVEISLDKLRKRTGLSRQGVIDGLRELKKLDLVAITKSPRNSRVPNHYALNLNLTTGELVHSLDQSKLLTSATSPQFRPQLVHNSDSLKPRKPNKKERAESEKLIPDSLSTKEKRKLTGPDLAVLAAFDPFYEAYPRHVGRQDALKAWLKLNPDADLMPVIMTAVERYAAEVRDTEPKFILHPATWLNGKRWEDEPAHGNGNGHVQPTEVKNLGDGWFEVNGMRMDRKTYERRHGQTAT